MEPISTTAALILGGSQLASSGLNAIFGRGDSGITWGDVERQMAMAGAQWKEDQRRYDMQRADYLSDVADERAYNSPLEQAKRLRDAGLNPALVFGEGNVGFTANAPSMPSANIPSAPSGYDRAGVNANIISEFANTLGASVGTFLDNQIRQNEVKRSAAVASQEDIKAQFAARMEEQRLIQEKNKARYGSVEYDKAVADLNFFRATMNDRIAQQAQLTQNMRIQSDVYRAQITELNSRAQLQDMQKKLAPYHLKVEQSKAQAAFISANAALNSSLAAMKQADTGENLSRAQIDKLASEAAVTWIKAAGDSIDYKMKDRYKAVIEEIYATDLLNKGIHTKIDTDLIPWDAFTRRLPKVMPFIPLK